MTAPAHCCSLNDSLEQVAALMCDHEIHALPVVDAAHAMLPDAPIVHQGLGIGRLEQRMGEHQTPWLAVLDDAGRVVGAVTSAADLRRVISQAIAARLEEPRKTRFAVAMRAIDEAADDPAWSVREIAMCRGPSEIIALRVAPKTTVEVPLWYRIRVACQRSSTQ